MDTNTGWILDFFGKAGDLEQSYFTIQSGYYDERKDIAVDQDARVVVNFLFGPTTDFVSLRPTLNI